MNAARYKSLIVAPVFKRRLGDDNDFAFLEARRSVAHGFGKLGLAVAAIGFLLRHGGDHNPLVVDGRCVTAPHTLAAGPFRISVRSSRVASVAAFSKPGHD